MTFGKLCFLWSIPILWSAVIHYKTICASAKQHLGVQFLGVLPEYAIK